MHRLFALGGAWSVGLALSACTYDFDAPFAGTSEGGGSTGTPSSGTEGPGSGGATTTASGSTSTSSAGSTATSSSSGVTSSSSSGPAPIEIACDGPCAFVPGDGGCCWDETLNHGDPQAQCFTSAPSGNDCRNQATPGGLETFIECQRAEHCEGGEVCCAVWEVASNGTVFYPAVECRSSCSPPSVTLCEGEGSPCDAGFECAPVEGLPEGYFGCVL